MRASHPSEEKAVIIRVFRPTIHPGKEREFESFLRETAVPLVSQQSGNLRGVSTVQPGAARLLPENASVCVISAQRPAASEWLSHGTSVRHGREARGAGLPLAGAVGLRARSSGMQVGRRAK